MSSGVIAQVYVAQLDGHLAAVKMIDWRNSQLGVMEERAFNREVTALAKARHPNIVEMYGIMSETKPLRIIVEFCAGGNLFDLLHTPGQVELSFQQKRKMATDVAQGVRYLHTQGILHRDLKSPNLLLPSPAKGPMDPLVVKIADFGIARIKPPGSGEADGWGRMTICVGTLNWMAPEVLHSNSYDEKVDVYSYGMCLYEIMSGQIPFEGEEHERLGEQVLRGIRPEKGESFNVLPEAVRDVIVACWSRNPKKRLSFDQILAALGGLPP